MSIDCRRGDAKKNKRSEHWSISPLCSSVFPTYVWCSCVVPSPFLHPLLLMLINLVFSLASHPGVLSRIPCLFAVHCAYFFLCSISWNCSMGHCSHIFICPLSAIIHVFDPFWVRLLTCFTRYLCSAVLSQLESVYALLVIQTRLDACFHLDLRLHDTSYILTNRFITHRMP